MNIRDFFTQNIDRSIETVIKADDKANVSSEVAEYVITQEIRKKIRSLFEAYKKEPNPSGQFLLPNGVWISGFFGSGKSHLLKILSYVLANKEVDGYNCGDLFAAKIEDDILLKADIEKAASIPSESILFNIDQQAQITSKTDENAILYVFYKVFYDHLGFFGSKLHVAEFEQWLSAEGKYQVFKEEFEKLTGKNWEKGRRTYFAPKTKDSIGKILSELYNDDADKYKTIIDDLRNDQSLSIEDFSNRVKDYINTKPKNFRLNFFVDEVGQYISDNTKLMLNLQTVAESLSTITKGRSWILVTSQEDIEGVIGEMNRQQQNDFSRIQARFYHKVNLTSANVDEVIEERLLKKTEPAKDRAIALFEKEKSHLETLVRFSDTGVQFRGFKNENDFVRKYPFLPYQFDLFQQCRKSLASHNAFQGKHASVGERSMLGVFQQVLQQMGNEDERALVSFDKMYEGIRNELKSDIQNSVQVAENNLDDLFAIRVLKALFLVKYYNNFKTTKRNISVLMLDHLDVDLQAQNKKIEEALNKLENQSYIQRNGDVYEFLTNFEKEVEVEIKNTEIDEQAETQLLKRIFFDEIITVNKIKYLDNNQEYEFVGKMDGSYLGREKELEIEIITQNNSLYTNPKALQAQTMGLAGMKLMLPANSNFMKDVQMYIRTDKYIRQGHSTSNTPEKNSILREKGEQNSVRKRNLNTIANQLLADAVVYMNGGEHEMSASSDGKTKVVKAFQDLVRIVYPNLRMLQNMQFSEETIKTVIRNPQDDLFGTDDTTMSQAESMVLSFVVRRKNNSERTSLSQVKDEFIKKPYGWYPNAIWTIIARLYKRGKLDLKQGPDALEDEDVIQALINSSYHGNVLLEQQEEVDPRQVSNLKKVFSEAFDETCPHNEPKEVARSFKENLNTLLKEVSQLLLNERQYPFVKTLQPFSEKLKEWTRKEIGWFITNQNDFEDELLDTKEDLLDPIRRFMNGEQRKIYDEVNNILSADTSNFIYVEGEELDVMNKLLQDKKPYTGNSIMEAKQAKDKFLEKLLRLLEEEKSKTIEVIHSTIGEFESNEDFLRLENYQKEEVLAPFKQQLINVKELRYISQIRDIKHKVQDQYVAQQLNMMMKFLEPVEIGGESKAAEPAPHYIRRSELKISYTKNELRSAEDVDEYVEALRRSLKEQINKNRRIRL